MFPTKVIVQTIWQWSPAFAQLRSAFPSIPLSQIIQGKPQQRHWYSSISSPTYICPPLSVYDITRWCAPLNGFQLYQVEPHLLHKSLWTLKKKKSAPPKKKKKIILIPVKTYYRTWVWLWIKIHHVLIWQNWAVLKY